MSTEIDYGEIKNISSEFNGTDRIGDYGEGKDKHKFCYTEKGWKPFFPDAYEAYYWKKKYEELLNKKQ